ncbi:MBL fold metallo-hydrolase [Mycobacterium sp. CBMA 623]|nr:MBL fold metallo-hydrolase [Mycobacteroides sp. CBMA 326]
MGAVTIHSVLEAVIPTRPERLFRELPAELPPSLSPHYVDDAGLLSVAIQSFFIECGEDLVVVDSCFGEDHDLPYRLPIDPDQYARSLAAAGFTPDAVTAVVCTHLHLDHAGRNTTLVDGVWVPTYPNAEYLITEPEYTFWQDNPEMNRAKSESVEPLARHDVLRLTDTDHAITENIQLVPTPGHTPGHCAVRVESAGAAALICGDVIHHPLQIAYPDICAFPDADPETSVATRTRLLEQLATDQTLLVGTHFAAPSSGTIKRGNEFYEWVPS